MRTTHLFIAFAALFLFACSDDTVKTDGPVGPKPEASVPTEGGGGNKEASVTNKEAAVPAAKMCQCAADADCTAVTGGIYKGCNTTTKTCFMCKVDADCTFGAKKCGTTGAMTGFCLACAADADCLTGPKKCDVPTNTCYGCATDADCTTGPKKCNTTTHQCQQCATDADCTTGLKKCNTTTNTCTQCATDADCSSSTTFKGCNKTLGACTVCTADAECKAIYPGSTNILCK